MSLMNGKNKWEIDGIMVNLEMFDNVYSNIGKAYRLPYVLSPSGRSEYIETLLDWTQKEMEYTFLHGLFEDDYVDKLAKRERSIISKQEPLEYSEYYGKSAAKIVISVLWMLQQEDDVANLLLGKIYKMTSALDEQWRFARVMAIIDLLTSSGKSVTPYFKDGNSIKYISAGFFRDRLDNDWYKKGAIVQDVCELLAEYEWDNH